MELAKRKPNRLENYDYRTAGGYFITICTRDKAHLFWKNVGAIIDRPENVPLNHLGQIVDQVICDIPCHYPAVAVDKYVIMPNHVHLLLRIETDDCGRSMIAPTLSKVIQQMKGTAVKKAGISIWQKGFYDHVIRGDEDYLECWRYIEENPRKWALAPEDR